MKKFLTYIILPLSIATLPFIACKKVLEVTPEYIITNEEAFKNDAAAKLAMEGVYSQFATSATLTTGLQLDMGMASDESDPINVNAFPSSGAYQLYYNTLRPLDAPTNSYWNDMYNYIYHCNNILANASSSTGMSTAFKNQCQGEALTMRAFFYYYLTNLFGPIPYVKDGNYSKNKLLGRAPVDSIRELCISDLETADSLLSAEYPSSGRFRVNKYAAEAILSRFYLQKGDYANTVNICNSIINSGLYQLASVDNIFLSDSKETILQFWNQLGYTDFASNAYSSFPGYEVTNLNEYDLYNQFEDQDLRKTSFITYDTLEEANYYVPYKYKNNAYNNTEYTEYPIVLKLDEIYLNRAEAYAKLNSNANAMKDLNNIRTRAAATIATSSSNIYDTIIAERRKELCFEWMDRWITLKRTGTMNAVLSIVKPNIWTTQFALYPIPFDVLSASSLTQNPGY